MWLQEALRLDQNACQHAEELEAAVAENHALREAAVKGGRAKEQVDALLEALKHEKDAHAAADQEAAAARQDNACLQQRVRPNALVLTPGGPHATAIA